MNRIRFLTIMLMSCVLFVLVLAPSSIGIYPPLDEYDSFADVTDPNNPGYPDGKIDIFDIVFQAIKYGTEGDPQRNVTFVDPINVNVTNWPYRYPWNPVGNYAQEIVIFSSEALLNQPNPVYRGGVHLDTNSDFAFLFQPIVETFNVTKACLVTTLHNNQHSVELARFSVRINGQTQEFSTAMSVDDGSLTQASLLLNSTLTDTIRQGINTMKLSSEGWHSGTMQWYSNYAFEIVLLIEYEYLS